MNALSFDVVTEGEETLLAALCLKNQCRFSECEPGILCTLLCKVQADVFASSAMLKVHSIDLSSHVGKFGFR